MAPYVVPEPVVSGWGNIGERLKSVARRLKPEQLLAGHQYLTNDHLRFWARMTGVSNIAKCRACEATVLKLEELERHKKDRGCTKRLVAAYALLCRDGLCVLCDEKTPFKMWGVPLCKDCIEDWPTLWVQPTILRGALALARAQEGGAFVKIFEERSVE